MANHVRQQIRESLAGLLTGLTTTGSNVYQSRLKPLQANELPALLIATDSEKIEPQGMGVNPMLERQLNISVKVIAKAMSNLDDTLDACIKEVEQAVNASVAANTLNGLVKETLLTDIEIDMNADSDMPTGQATLLFIASYYTQAATPDVSL